MSKPRGTLRYTVGETSLMFFRLVSKGAPGTGLPASRYIVPPLRSTMLKLWLLPKVWLHGSQSTTTGGVRSRKGQICALACWLEHIMRWVLITAFGAPTEPEVNRNLAMVSPFTRA